MKTCIVTGGAGFIGSHIVDRLIEEGYKVVVIDNLSSGRKENLNSKAIFYEMDIQDLKIYDIFEKEKPDVLFHYAAQIDVRKSVKDPVMDAETNILGSLNLLESCRKNGVKKVIFASTGGAIYGDANIIPTPETYTPLPLSPYSLSKNTVEKYLGYYSDVFNLDFIVLRLSNIYGPRQNVHGEAGVVSIFSGIILKNEQPTIYGDGSQTRDYLYVKDVVEANIVALKSSVTGIFNIGTQVETSVTELFNMMCELINVNVEPILVPLRLGEQQRSCLDVSLAKEVLSWEYQFDLKKGLEQTIGWFKNESGK